MKAIIPIAGLGTRLLPFSKVIPKAMLPVHNKPSLQWIVEELNEAGIEEIIIVYSKGQEMVKDYFTESNWYDDELRNREKLEHAEHLENIRNLAKFHFVEQKEQLGDGHAILQAKEHINPEEGTIVIFGDCLHHGENMIKKIVQKYKKHGKSIIAVSEIDPEETHHYGIVGVTIDSDPSTLDHRPSTIDQLIEKPQPSEAPSNLAIIGRYLLSPNIWKYLEEGHSKSGEARLIDALEKLLEEEEIHAHNIEGTWLDTGTIEKLHEATQHFRKRESE